MRFDRKDCMLQSMISHDFIKFLELISTKHLHQSCVLIHYDFYWHLHPFVNGRQMLLMLWELTLMAPSKNKFTCDKSPDMKTALILSVYSKEHFMDFDSLEESGTRS
jgi:hypothetical protein